MAGEITRREQLTGELERFMPRILAALPYETAKQQERFKAAILSLAADPNVQQCDTASVIVAAYRSSQIGLVPNSALHHAAVVPRKGKAALEIEYRGFIELARRSELIADVVAAVVYSNDHFERRGHFQEPVHERWDELGRTEPGEFRGAYCITLWKDGHVSTTWMNARDVNKRKDVAATQAVWNHWFDEMACKTVIKHASKTWPLTDQIALAVEADDAAQTGRELPSPKELPATAQGDPLVEQLRRKKADQTADVIEGTAKDSGDLVDDLLEFEKGGKE